MPSVGPHSYVENAVVNITATPALGYAFSSWTGGVADPNAASTTVTMNADKTVTANFMAVSTYVLTTAVNPPGGGTINPAAGPHTYNQSTVVAVTATPNSGYAFSSWTGACTGTDPGDLLGDHGCGQDRHGQLHALADVCPDDGDGRAWDDQPGGGRTSLSSGYGGPHQRHAELWLRLRQLDGGC